MTKANSTKTKPANSVKREPKSIKWESYEDAKKKLAKK